MTRDPGQPTAALHDVAGSDELLTAYVDGISELAVEDRRRIEAQLTSDPATRAEHAAVREVLDRLRSAAATADPSGEPDWVAMERSIRLAVGTDVPRPWWRRWRWLAPTVTFATAATVMILMWSRPTPGAAPDRAPRPAASGPDPARDPAVRDVPAAEVVPLWLDGDEVDVELSASDLLGEPGVTGDDDAAQAERAAASDEVRLLPATDLAWVDHLDDEALARAERWLAGKKG